MLLPSALPCDHSQVTGAKSSRPLLRRFMPYSSSAGFLPTLSTLQQTEPTTLAIDTTNATASLSSFPTPSSISSGISSTCRALQSLLGVTPSAAPATIKRNKVPSPPTGRDTPLRARPVQDNRISKRRTSPVRPPPPPRGKNKRTREDYETSEPDMGMEIDHENSSGYTHYRNSSRNYDSGYPGSSSSDGDAESAGLDEMKQFSTPKRRRRLPGPVDLPFGLDRQDFADLEGEKTVFSTPRSVRRTSKPEQGLTSIVLSTPIPAATDVVGEDEESEDWWTPLDDEQLVTLVLEKMKLSRRDWEDCAKVLGAEGEGGSLGKRWKWLMGEGKVGLKSGLENGARFEGRRTSRRQGRGDVRMMF